MGHQVREKVGNFILGRVWEHYHLLIWPRWLSQESTCFKAERSWVQIPARYSGWPGHYNNVGCSARLEISFELNPVTEGKDKDKDKALFYIGFKNNKH